ncbi:hypothetical protein WJ97_12245 [Burkholderia ubonensis]|uniref:hypothetical protein n=1 Tax=Burkholderia ubonensis TaxID=101571 RepID=UPI000755F46C|nr:hypothetical protein [Burkholderia ubonensis]KVP96647.1 hypothetical protein WJ97_12245 [Burkholderia ubonensis]
MSQSLHPEKTLVEAQLGLYFAVGPAGDANDETNADRQTNSFKALEALFNERGMSELGKSDPTVSEDFRFLPFELCACEWDGEDVDGQVVYSIWFHSGSAIEPAAAAKLRAMALEAYTAVCGPDARFVRAETYQKWTFSERSPLVFAD